MPDVSGANVTDTPDVPDTAGPRPAGAGAPNPIETPDREPDALAGEWQVEPRLVGRRIGGRYLLQRLHASGGMAWLYQAVDEQLGRTVAVKLLRPEFGRDATFAARFRQEAHSARSEEHTSELQSRQYLVCRLLLEK